jgi:hypothetical protein
MGDFNVWAAGKCSCFNNGCSFLGIVILRREVKTWKSFLSVLLHSTKSNFIPLGAKTKEGR